MQFVRNEICAREGVVRMVMLRGGAYGLSDQGEDLIEHWYCQPENMVYILTARDHDHRIGPSNFHDLRHSAATIILAMACGTWWIVSYGLSAINQRPASVRLSSATG